MTMTVGRRIVLGFSLIIALLVIITLVGMWGSNSVSATYERALQVRRHSLVPALRAESEFRGSNMAYLRFLLEGGDQHMRVHDSTNTVVISIMTQLRDSASSDADRAAWDGTAELYRRWVQAAASAMDASRANDPAEALRIRSTVEHPIRVALESAFRDAVGRATAASDRVAAEGSATSGTTRTVLLVGGLLALLLGVASAMLLHAAISRPLQETSTTIASGSAEILAATTEQAAGANETLAAVSQTVATVDEVTQTAEQATERARAVADSARRAAEIGKAGRRAVEESVAGMQQVRDQVESIGQSILSLADQAQAIGEIVAAVTEIAEQTNLLALNAAVEAARAGDAGRGFAVVASEIKSLADQSKRATVQVRQILGEIQRATSAAVMATEQGTKGAASARRQVGEADETIRALAEAVDEAAQTASQIVASAGQQALGMEQIRHAVGSIHQATQQNLTASRQSEQAAHDLTTLGERLTGLVGRRKEALFPRREV